MRLFPCGRILAKTSAAALSGRPCIPEANDVSCPPRRRAPPLRFVIGPRIGRRRCRSRPKRRSRLRPATSWASATSRTSSRISTPSLRFYRDAIGLAVTVTQPFAPNDAIAKLGATEGGQSRIAVLDVPGSEFGVELIEYKDIARTVQRPRFYDPGAANLQLRMRDIDPVFAQGRCVSRRQGHHGWRQARDDRSAERRDPRGVRARPRRLRHRARRSAESARGLARRQRSRRGFRARRSRTAKPA